MKIKILFFLLISVVGFSQKKKINEEYDYINNYYQLVYQAQYEYLKEDYQKAYDLLKTAEKNCPLLKQMEINEPAVLAECAMRLNKPEEAVHYIEILVRDYGANFEGFKNSPLYKDIQNTRYWRKLERKAKKYHEAYLKQVNLDLRNEILKMKEEDQSVRINRDYEGLKRVDSINYLKLRKIVADCDCFPDEMFPQFGNYTIDDKFFSAVIFVYHINSEDAEYWKPIFLDLIRRGRAPAEIYGTLIDSNLRSNGVYLYGIYSNIGKDLIDDFENLDKRRIAVGLPPWQLEKDIHELIKKKYGI
ncbi:hypothetical protein [Flavobacterium lacisediminis]|uniref:Tetratricopeptide repeat protein n=1 Tax=Flavobacterium lacisediminis TaxID=2989705 RepID=A0ABT3EFY3_9FLAO|nr:hypothetical protein [Flavobacterium lacisediminis]MCW1147469.1 hypothetical protein [Flavobacterium lacisediminis]